MAYQDHARWEWLQYSDFGCTGPTPISRFDIEAIIIHYTGGNFNISSTTPDETFARQMAAINDQYHRDPNRGYAIGYNWGVAGPGDRWELRGSDIRCAANGCQAVNRPYVAVLAPTATIGSQPTLLQRDALKNQWIPQLRQIYPNAQVQILGHRDVRPLCGDGGATACPGEPWYSIIRSGELNQPGAPLPPPTGDTEMAMLLASSDGDATRKATVFSWSGSAITEMMVDIDLISLGDATNVLAISPGDPQRAFRRPAAEIQNLINRQWAGPRSATPTNLGGYTIPADPSIKPVTDGFTSTNTVMANGFGAVDVDLTRIEDKVDALGAGGPGGGASKQDFIDVVNKTVVDDAVPSDKLRYVP
jgi:hypothetical protein